MRWRIVFAFFTFILASFSTLAYDWNYLGDAAQPLRDVYFVNEYTGWAVGGSFFGSPSPSLIIKTTDGGATWVTQYSASSGQFQAVTFYNATLGWVVGDGLILNTVNGGQNWTSQSLPGTSVIYRDISFYNSTTLYAVGWNGRILKTTNGGTLWSIQSSGTTEMLESVYVVNSEIVFAVGSSGTVLKTTNGGLRWDRQEQLRSASNIPLSLNAIQCFDADRCRIAASNDYICSTTSGGSDWTCDRTGGVIGFGTLSYLNFDQGWATGGPGGDLRYYDTGTWAVQTSDRAFPFHLRSIQVREARCTPAGRIGYVVGDDFTGSGKIFRYGSLPAAPSFPQPECPSGNITEVRDANYCLTGYTCVTPPAQPTARLREPNVTWRVANRTSCQPVMIDCQARFRAVLEYNSSGCVVGYQCVPQRKIRIFVGQAIGEGNGEGGIALGVILAVVAIIIVLLLYVKRRTAVKSSLPIPKMKKKR